jgi:ribulose-5-phosphate 4-epimerase/fuculose-1-phosphate aldolase
VSETVREKTIMSGDTKHGHEHEQMAHGHLGHDHPHPHTHNAPVEDIATLESDLRLASTILEWEAGDIFGHVGVRLPSGEGIACKMFRPAGQKDEDWLVHFDYSGKKIGGISTPPMESPIYTEIMKRRPDVQAVVHTHSPACVALSLADIEIRAIHMQSHKFAGGVPIYPHPIHIKEMDEGIDLAQMLAEGKAIVIKGHGVVTVGKNIDEACMNALYLERTAKIMGLARTLGFTGPTQEFMDEIVESGRRMQAKPDSGSRTAARGGHSNEWMYYKHRIARGEKWTRGWS